MPATLSVAMCTYNGARHLEAQLDSLAAQTRLPDELVVCDDASVDDTRALVAAFAARAPFPVHVHINERNLGSTASFEATIGRCTGDIIALSDQDDVWLPDKLARLAMEFDRAPDVGLVFSDADVVDERGQPTGRTLWDVLPLTGNERRRLRAGDAVERLLPGSTVTGATLAFRARYTNLVLPIPHDMSLIHDAWIAVLIGAVSDVLPLATPLVRYRAHADQQIGTRPRESPRGGIIRAWTRTASYEDIVATIETVRRRLVEHRHEYACERALSRLTARLQHLQTRAHLPGQVVPRLVAVGRELVTGRYHRYSRGVQSAAKDVLRRGSSRGPASTDGDE